MKNFIERLEELQNALRKDGKFAEGFNVARNAAISIYNELHPQTETIAPEPNKEHTEGSFKVRITKCENRNSWYFEKVGECFDVEEFQINDYITTEYLNGWGDTKGLISKSDCEIIPETTVIPFNYQRWKDGDYVRVVTVKGKEVTQLHEFDGEMVYQFCGIIEGVAETFTKEGSLYQKTRSDKDLHLEIAKPKQVTTYHYVGKISGLVVGVDGLTDISQIDNLIIGETITEQQPDGSFKIISTTLK